MHGHSCLTSGVSVDILLTSGQVSKNRRAKFRCHRTWFHETTSAVDMARPTLAHTNLRQQTPQSRYLTVTVITESSVGNCIQYSNVWCLELENISRTWSGDPTTGLRRTKMAQLQSNLILRFFFGMFLQPVFGIQDAVEQAANIGPLQTRSLWGSSGTPWREKVQAKHKTTSKKCVPLLSAGWPCEGQKLVGRNTPKSASQRSTWRRFCWAIQWVYDRFLGDFVRHDMIYHDIPKEVCCFSS